MITWEQKTRDACQRRRCEKDCCPTVGCLGTQHRGRYDDAGHDSDQADHNVKERERRRRHSQNHDAPPSGFRVNGAEKWSLPCAATKWLIHAFESLGSSTERSRLYVLSW